MDELSRFCAEVRDMEFVPTREEPASRLASRRCPGFLPNAKYRAEARTRFYKWNMKKVCRRI